MGTMNERGSVLILSLWVMALMVLTATSLAYRSAIELHLARNQWDEIREIQEAKIAARTGTGSGFEDESARIDVNRAPKEDLARLFANHPDVVSKIIEWRTSISKSARFGDNDYEGLGYSSRHGSFKSMEELLLVKNMTPDIFKEVRDDLTVYGSRGVNINTASERVLEAIGLPVSLANKILQMRAARNESISNLSQVMPLIKENVALTEAEAKPLTALLQKGRLIVQSDTAHFRTGKFDIVVIRRPSPGQILSWQERSR